MDEAYYFSHGLFSLRMKQRLIVAHCSAVDFSASVPVPAAGQVTNFIERFGPRGARSTCGGPGAPWAGNTLALVAALGGYRRAGKGVRVVHLRWTTRTPFPEIVLEISWMVPGAQVAP